MVIHNKYRPGVYKGKYGIQPIRSQYTLFLPLETSGVEKGCITNEWAEYRISPYLHRVSNKCLPVISATSFYTQIYINAAL